MQGPMARGSSRFRIALVGQPNSGKTTIFRTVSSTSVQTGELAGTHKPYGICTVQIGLDEASLVDLPGIDSLRHLKGEDLEALKYLLWGDARPPVSLHEREEPPVPFARPDVLIQVVDASALERSLKFTLELIELGLPVVVALNMMDEARRKGVSIDPEQMSKELGIPVIPTMAVKGHGIPGLFDLAVQAVRQQTCPLPQPASEHIEAWARRLNEGTTVPGLHTAFQVPQAFLLSQLLEGDDYFVHELESHFPECVATVLNIREEANRQLPRHLSEEAAIDRHHRAARLFQHVAALSHKTGKTSWEDRLDAVFLHKHWGIVGALGVFAAVLFVVFEISATLDALTSARLANWVSLWHPQTTAGVVGRAVADGLVGLIGIVVPYMLPLVLMLVAFEESGVMQRIAFIVDRAFHRIGLHGKVALPFLLGLGCNVPAIAATKSVVSGRDRIVASLLITFVPCSARSAIILALGGKYLGGLGVFGIFMLDMVIIGVLGRMLTRRYPETSPGLIQEIPAYRVPAWKALLRATWQRTSDILTIVTPLLVGGSVVLALLQHVGADDGINALLSPVTSWGLGLPVALGVPILFGVLRKELSLLMVFQALGTFEVGQVLDWVQITTFLIFLTFYIPCISTFAVMLKIIGRREALFSIALSVGVALIVAGTVRFGLEAIRLLSG